jgi:diguanylate cyclase (GGDEF)-like protein
VHALLAKQLAKVARATGGVDVATLTDLVSAAYSDNDRDRRRLERSMALMIEELDQHSNRDREILLRQVSSQNARFDAALENMFQGLSMFDTEQRLVVCNRQFREIYDLTADAVQPGTLLGEILARPSLQALLADGQREEIAALAMTGEPWSRTYELSDGRILSVFCRPTVDGGFVATHADITERRRAELKITHMARHDALTDLPNRLLLRERLDHALKGVGRGQAVAVLSLDLDRFKGVNDTFGHPTGDQLLVAVGNRLRAMAREVDTVARLGGDEFAIVQVGVLQPTNAGALAERVINAFDQPFAVDGHQIAIGTSVGITISPNDGHDADQLIKNADMALYRAKADGRGAFRFFEPAMDAEMKARHTLEIGLRKALIDREFELYYQPIMNLAGNRLSGFEALLRWHHPERGLVLPDEFIPLAEEVGLIVPMGGWVLRQACLEAAGWPEDIAIAVNLSPAQFKSKGLVEKVKSVLAETGLHPTRLILEITETVVMQDSESTLAMLHQLRGLGAKIAMDDFGTGFSSLGYLRRFPFDRIKIDRSFISDMPNRSDSLSIVRAVTSLGSSLGMPTVAEGVESEEQLDLLRDQGCNEVQGYLFSAPVPVEQVHALIDKLHGAADPRAEIRDRFAAA